MPRDYAALPYTQIRRQDRAVEDEVWIQALLKRAAVGTLATVYDGQPFINSNLFVYDDTQQVIYMHTARVGRTPANIEGYERVCFSTLEMGRLLPAQEALEFSVEYASVVVFGRATVVSDAAEAEHGLRILLQKYAPHLAYGKDYRQVMPEELARTAVYRIEIEHWTGKRKQVAADFPGAYLYQEVAA